MALRPQRPAWSLSRQAIRSYSTPLARHPTALREQNDPLNRDLSEEDMEDSRPRWSYTPEAMIGPHGFSLNKIKVPSRAIWHVNQDPAKLDDFYERFLGLHGQRMLPDEVKWLAVTHKSFDYGRRGFNTRLAYFGRQTIILETMNHIMTRPVEVADRIGDPWDREPYKTPASENVDKLSMLRPQDFCSVQRLAQIGFRNRLDEVIRWKPRNPQNLTGSGIDTVMATALYAIIGALSLQHGGEVAGRIAREKVLARMPSRVSPSD